MIKLISFIFAFLLFIPQGFSQSAGIFDLENAKLCDQFDPANAKQIDQFLIDLSGTPTPTCIDYIDYSDINNRTSQIESAGAYNTQNYKGFVLNIPGTSITVCEVYIYYLNPHGNPTVNDYYLEIHSLSGNNFASMTPEGRSNKLDALYWYGNLVLYTFDPPVVVNMSSGTRFAFAQKSVDDNDPATTLGEIDLTNFSSIGLDTTSPTMTGCDGMYFWTSAGVGTLINSSADPIALIRVIQP